VALDTDYVCDLLLSVGMITDEQAEEARQKASDGSVDVLGALEMLGHATEDEALDNVQSAISEYLAAVRESFVGSETREVDVAV